MFKIRFQMYVLYTIWKYTWSAMILAKKNFKIQNEQQTDLKTAIVATIRKKWEQWNVRAIFETKYFLNLSQEVSQKNNWGLETCRKS